MVSSTSLNHSCGSGVPLGKGLAAHSAIGHCCWLQMWEASAWHRGLDCPKPQILIPHLFGKPATTSTRQVYWIQTQHSLAFRAQSRQKSGSQRQHLTLAFSAKTFKTLPYTWMVAEAPWLCLWSLHLDLHCNTCNHVAKHSHLQYRFGGVASGNKLQRTWTETKLYRHHGFWTSADFLQLVCILPWEISISFWHPFYISSGYHGDKELLPWLWEWLALVKELLSNLSKKAQLWVQAPFSLQP